MSREIYTAAAGGMAVLRQMDAISNNLANAETPGFKAQRVHNSSFRENLAGAQVVSGSSTDLARDGVAVTDGVSTHLSLSGRGFFAVLEDGAPVAVRKGDFALDASGGLVDAAGRPVLGRDGPVRVPAGDELRVGPDGTIFDGEGQAVDSLRLVDAEQMVPRGDGAWVNHTPLVAAKSAKIQQGALEGSAVDPLGEMVALIEASRAFEIAQRAMKTADELDGMANQLAGVR
jgi:flagellar basal-body rod protein FlgF